MDEGLSTAPRGPEEGQDEEFAVCSLEESCQR